MTLSGGIYAEGTKTPVTVSYRTSFGALTGAATVFGDDPTAPTDPTDPTDPAVPTYPTPPAASSMPVYRFYNKANGSHFYTVSAEERDTVIANLSHIYSYEGVAYFVGM
mgnify:CR=1 FL=1